MRSERRSPSKPERFARQSICRPDRDFSPSIPKRCSSELENRKERSAPRFAGQAGSLRRFENLPLNHRIEIEEGAAAFMRQALRRAPPAYATSRTTRRLVEPLPSQVETWLIEPLKAPEFSLPDLAGDMRELR